jgi:hypothetical protein
MQSALRLRRSPAISVGKISTANILNSYLALAEKYNEIRQTYKGRDTPHRRQLMLGVFSEMVELSLEQESLNVLPYWDGENWGRRLAAYVYFYTHPNVEVLSELINSTEHAGLQPFVQHRGIEAIGKVLERYNSGSEVLKGIEKLRSLVEHLDPKTLRHAELSRILKKFEKTSVEELIP